MKKLFLEIARKLDNQNIPHTEDNETAIENIYFKDDVLTFKSSSHELQDLAWDLEDLEIPKELKEKYSQEDWESFTRLITLIVSSN